MREIPFTVCPKLCSILPITPLRKTEGVTFDSIPEELLRHSSGAERVIHRAGAYSPNAIGEIKRPWYCHKAQDDHLMVLYGDRDVELFHPSCNQIFRFHITPEAIFEGEKLLFEGGAILRWRAGVFHRITSSKELGSASFNFAVRYDDFDIQHEFDIYDLDTLTGKSVVIRAGFLDQNE